MRQIQYRHLECNRWVVSLCHDWSAELIGAWTVACMLQSVAYCQMRRLI